MTPARIAARLHAAIDEGLQLFQQVDETRTTKRPSEHAWCAREVLGHLIDSACNNHRRFVIGQSAAALTFDGYDQDEWVRRQGYAKVPWRDLVALWAAYNRHLAHVIGCAPDDVVAKPHADHNLDQLGVPIPTGAPATLSLLMDGYVTHLKHHIDQIRSLLAA